MFLFAYSRLAVKCSMWFSCLQQHLHMSLDTCNPSLIPPLGCWPGLKIGGLNTVRLLLPRSLLPSPAQDNVAAENQNSVSWCSMNESNFKMSIGLGMQLIWWSVCLAHIMNKTLHSIQHHASQPWWLTRGILALKNWVQEYQVSKAIRLQLHSRFRRGCVRTYLFFF